MNTNIKWKNDYIFYIYFIIIQYTRYRHASMTGLSMQLLTKQKLLQKKLNSLGDIFKTLKGRESRAEQNPGDISDTRISKWKVVKEVEKFDHVPEFTNDFL